MAVRKALFLARFYCPLLPTILVGTKNVAGLILLCLLLFFFGMFLSFSAISLIKSKGISFLWPHLSLATFIVNTLKPLRHKSDVVCLQGRCWTWLPAIRAAENIHYVTALRTCNDFQRTSSISEDCRCHGRHVRWQQFRWNGSSSGRGLSLYVCPLYGDTTKVAARRDRIELPRACE